jgi:hypothetical protein
MKIAKYFQAFLLGLVVYFVRTDCTPQIVQGKAPIRTDKPVYGITYTLKRVKIQRVKISIKTSYTNRTGTTVYLAPGCGGPLPLMLEKKVGDQWVAAYNLPVAACAMLSCLDISSIPDSCVPHPGYPIEPGKIYVDRFDVEVFPPNSDKEPKFNPAIKEIGGTYRLVRLIHNNRGLLPLEERISNEFNITDSRTRQQSSN